MTITRRKFIGASAALAAVATLPLPRVQTFQAEREPWRSMPEYQHVGVNTWLRQFGVDPNLTYRVDIQGYGGSRGVLTAYQFHGPKAHRACSSSVGHWDDACRIAPFQVPVELPIRIGWRT